MFGLVKRMWRAAPWATALLGLALVVALFFAVRLTVFTIYWADPAHHDQAIAGWMTPRYIANSWDLPPEVVMTALGLEKGGGRGVSLDQLAKIRGVPVADLIGELQAAIAAQRLAK